MHTVNVHCIVCSGAVAEGSVADCTSGINRSMTFPPAIYRMPGFARRSGYFLKSCCACDSRLFSCSAEITTIEGIEITASSVGVNPSMVAATTSVLLLVLSCQPGGTIRVNGANLIGSGVRGPFSNESVVGRLRRISDKIADDGAVAGGGTLFSSSFPQPARRIADKRKTLLILYGTNCSRFSSDPIHQ
jgi:hypothetical protein